MGYAVLAYDGEDAEAPARRMAARDRHLQVLTQWAGDGRLAFGTPLLADDGRALGSFMVLAVPDEAGLRAYLAAEPFNNTGVWTRVTSFPFRIAPLPYRPLPQPGTPLAREIGHVPMSGEDGMMAQLAKLRGPRKVFVHLNNTNPILDRQSDERKAVLAGGWEIAEDGWEL